MIHIFGFGAGGLPTLSSEARRALDTCQTVFGGARHLALIPDGPAKQPWPKPWRLPLTDIQSAKGPVGILVSGDPSWYSAATELYDHFDCTVWPAPGAFSLAAARMGWALEDVETDTLHGRGQAHAIALASHISRIGGRYLLLCDRKSLKAFVTALTDLAFTPVQNLTLLCDMGSAEERCQIFDLDAPQWPDTDLFTLAIDVDPQPRLLLDADFLPDEAFESHGKITKFDARQSAIAQLRRATILWDVGAGAGTVGLQAAYTLQPDHVFLIEQDAEALKVLERNCANASAPSVLVAGKAPDALSALPTPDAIFIGGGLHDPAVLPLCFGVLAPGGRLVAHAVTLESEAVLLDFFKTHSGAKLNRIQISAADPVGGLHGWRPTMPLTQLVIEKPLRIEK